MVNLLIVPVAKVYTGNGFFIPPKEDQYPEPETVNLSSVGEKTPTSTKQLFPKHLFCGKIWVDIPFGIGVITIIRVLKTNFLASQVNTERLFACNRTSSQIWNDCLTLAKEHHQQTGKWISKSDLHHATKGKYPIHSQSIQAVYEKYVDARDNAKRAREAGYTQIRYPYREKKHFNTRWKKDGFRIFNNSKIELSMGLLNGKRQKPITVRVKNLPPGKIKEIELIYDRGLKLALAYDDGLKPKQNQNTNTSAVDLGEIHSIAAVTENRQGIIITGRKVRSIKRLRNKKIGQLQKKISRCKKGSRQWKKYRQALNYILAKSEAQLKDSLHKTTRCFVNWCVENKVKQVIVGDVEGIERNTAKKHTRNQNQKISQWQFGKINNYLTYKLGCEGISLKKVNEEYTSQTCPVCGKRKKVSSRTYECKCGYKEHRDIHGAKNILTKSIYGEFRDMGPVKRKYLRIA